jgi:hypothetical protein
MITNGNSDSTMLLSPASPADCALAVPAPNVTRAISTVAVLNVTAFILAFPNPSVEQLASTMLIAEFDHRRLCLADQAKMRLHFVFFSGSHLTCRVMVNRCEPAKRASADGTKAIRQPPTRG